MTTRGLWRWTGPLLLVAGLTGCDGTRGPTASFELAVQGIYTGALSPDSRFGLVGSLNHGASLWRTSDHARLYNWNHREGEYADLVAADISADGRRAVTTDPRTLVVWDTASGEALSYWTTPSTVLDVALVPNSELVLMGLEDHSAVLFFYCYGDHRETLLHEAPVGAVAVSADGRWAITGSDDETAVLWRVDDGEAVHRLSHGNPVRQVAISASGSYLFTASQNQRVAIWDGATGQVLHTLSERNRGITSARFSSDERHLLVGYVNHVVELWDVVTGSRVQRWNTRARDPWRPTGGAVLAVGFSAAGGRYFALAGDGRLVELSRS